MKKKHKFGDKIGYAVMAWTSNQKVRCTKTLTKKQAIKARIDLEDLNAIRPKVTFTVCEIVYTGD